jgi:UDP-sugar transporter A1/2/3
MSADKPSSLSISSEQEAAAAASAASSNSKASFKLLLLTIMVLQNTATVLVGRYTRAGVSEDQLYDVNHLILIAESCKLIVSAALEYHVTSGKLWASLDQHVFRKPLDALKILVPSLLYLVQTTLLYVALTNLTAPIFQVTYQGKLVTTAFVSVIMLQSKYSRQQWICLVVLSFGVAIVVLGEKKSSSPQKDTEGQNLFLGLCAVMVACFSSALAGVYFEKVLKRHDGKEAQASLWMRNMQMAFFSVLIAAIQAAMKQPAEAGVEERSFLHGFTFSTWVMVVLQSSGGLLVAVVIKYADNVLKGLATSVSVVSSSILSMLLFRTPLGMQFWSGAVLILSSVYFFSNPLPFEMNQVVPPPRGRSQSGEREDLLLPK